MHPAITTPAVAIEIAAPTLIPIQSQTNPTTNSPSSPSIPSTPRDASETSTTAPLLHTAADTTTAPTDTTTPCPAPATIGRKTRKGVLYTTAIFLPPLAVYFRRGTNKDFGISVVLGILGW
jgi:uncharacterized membrane protein YqaE (UPF0057 family)